MKFLKPGHLYIASVCILMVVCLRYVFQQIWTTGKSNYKKLSSIDKQTNYQEAFRKLGFLNSQDKLDSFSKGNYIDKKFLQLISSTNLASKSFSAARKNISGSEYIDFSYVLDELTILVNVKDFYSSLWSCNEISKIQIKDELRDLSNRRSYSAIHLGNILDVEIAKANIDEMISADCGASNSDNSQINLDRCFLLKNRRLLDEAALLMQLPHKNIARILGLCVQRPKTGRNSGNELAASGIVLVREGGVPARIEHLKTLEWEDRFKICLDLLNLVIYLTNSPLGSIRLKSWNVENFSFMTEQKRVQLNTLDRLLYFNQPSCTSDDQCYVDGINCGLKCISQRCVGYNSRKNLLELNQAFLSPLLRHNVPEHLSEQVLAILLNLNSLKSTASDVLRSLQPLVPKFAAADSIADENAKLSAGIDSPAALSMQKLPDGFQLDSWELHEDKVTINEVLFAPVNFEKRPIEAIHKEDSEAFQKIENADFPGRYDYFCPGSKADWGCVMSAPNPQTATDKCLKDTKCKAVVTLPHIRKEGWVIAILKSDNSNPVDHAGTNVYIRQPSGGLNSQKQFPQDGDIENGDQVACFSDILQTQAGMRKLLEERFMRACGWPGMTHEKWSAVITEGKILKATSFKPARGKLANGGQMDVVVEYNEKSYPAVFLAKRGPEEFSVSQLAVYQLDHLLGLYKSVPAFERLMSVDDLEEAGFPVDIGGNLFDEFRSLKQPDGSLIGVVVPKVAERSSTEHYMSVPRLSAITNAVTPLTKKQWSDLEYLLLGFLASIPSPAKGPRAVKDQLLHLKNEESFLRRTADYTSYLYNCQFPAHLVAVLRHAQSRRCDVGSALLSRLLSYDSPAISKVLSENVSTLLHLVDECVGRFGEKMVLYESVVDPMRR